MVRLTDCPNMTIDVFHGHKTITQEQQQSNASPEVYQFSISQKEVLKI